MIVFWIERVDEFVVNGVGWIDNEGFWYVVNVLINCGLVVCVSVYLVIRIV